MCKDLLTVALPADTFCPMRVVAHPNEATAAIASVGEAVGAGPQDGLVVGVGTAVELIEVVTVLLVGQGPLTRLAVCLVV